MRKVILGFFVLLIIQTSSAQIISSSVIASNGDFLIGAGLTLSGTTGEMTMVETFSSPNNILTQGFQQPLSNLITAIVDPAFPGLIIKIFPNPSSGKFYLSLITPHTISLKGTIYDLIGKEVYGFEINQSSGQNVYQYNLNNLPGGMYILDLNLTSRTSPFGKKIKEKIVIFR